MSADGKVLAEEKKVQHNRSYGARKDLLAKMLETVISAVKNGGEVKTGGEPATAASGAVAAGA